MVQLNTLTNFLNKTLRINEFEEDKSQNGLQVEPENSKKDIKKIAIAVDATQEVFEKAKNYDLLIVHHGLFWKHNPLMTGFFRKRIKTLLENDLALYAAHLPLDANETYGNNVELAKILNANIKRKLDVGYVAELNKEQPSEKIIKILNQTLNTNCKIYGIKKQSIKKILLCSGGSASLMRKLNTEEVDAFILGEITHPHNKDAEELNIQIIAAGHYATETLGVKAIAKKIKQIYPEVTINFIDCPTGL